MSGIKKHIDRSRRSYRNHQADLAWFMRDSGAKARVATFKRQARRMASAGGES